MTKPITTKQLLDLLVKAGKVSCYATFIKENEKYAITIHADWDDSNKYFPQVLTLKEEGLYLIDDSGVEGGMEFYTLNSTLDCISFDAAFAQLVVRLSR